MNGIPDIRGFNVHFKWFFVYQLRRQCKFIPRLGPCCPLDIRDDLIFFNMEFYKYRLLAPVKEIFHLEFFIDVADCRPMLKIKRYRNGLKKNVGRFLIVTRSGTCLLTYNFFKHELLSCFLSVLSTHPQCILVRTQASVV